MTLKSKDELFGSSSSWNAASHIWEDVLMLTEQRNPAFVESRVSSLVPAIKIPASRTDCCITELRLEKVDHGLRFSLFTKTRLITMSATVLP